VTERYACAREERLRALPPQEGARIMQGYRSYSFYLMSPQGGLSRWSDAQCARDVQCKHRQPETRCDDEAIIDLLKARQSYDGSDRLIAVTNAAGFTAKAKERADRFGVILIARDRVTAWPHGCL